MDIFTGFNKATIKTFGVGHSLVQNLTVAGAFVFPRLVDVREASAQFRCLELTYCGETGSKADVPQGILMAGPSGWVAPSVLCFLWNLSNSGSVACGSLALSLGQGMGQLSRHLSGVRTEGVESRISPKHRL